MGAYGDYKATVVDRFWDYAESEFGDRPSLFKQSARLPDGPPEFVLEEAEYNLLYPPSAEPRVRQAIVTSLPPRSDTVTSAACGVHRLSRRASSAHSPH